MNPGVPSRRCYQYTMYRKGGRGGAKYLSCAPEKIRGTFRVFAALPVFLLQFGMERFALPESIVLGHGDCKDRRGRMICEGEPCK